MKRTLFSTMLVAAALLTGACQQDKPEVGEAGMNAAATEAAANPVVDNPNVAGETAEAPNPNAPVMTFTETEHDFKDIAPNSVVKHTFEFTNTGKTPLLIENAQASCGCTVPSWPKEPVAPGQKGSIDVQFDAHGKSGIQNKQITIRANTQPSITQIAIRGNVLTDGAQGPVRQ
ncbi:DUF1573 domain-containing protein [Hymenobacter busanensis]|uniref:DUF1573 domain-containing protein n=1 Tax=Hymenobacter busanensis TaxID=2607656 RepID=A0A7L4ZYU9_9BACT|nr:DUF1573 domain-containing protein [Hymenobacter busanensis]KAA9331290.1 DUF1573 domain-containing protein [Hymenobacter busanensis]QHJ08441.1 DUF1573 domain-containing protein [Hymenobacter busanensis]